MPEKRMNVKQLVDDLGGARAVATLVGVNRTAPYRWIKHGYVGSTVLAKIKTAKPNLDLNYYFEDAFAQS